tara:strand:- start:159 stop:320 length:162 start_codon:yes stop_codon:yes gene_type:complete
MSYRKEKRHNKRLIDKKKKERKQRDKKTKKEIGQFDKLETRKQLGKNWTNWIE